MRRTAPILAVLLLAFAAWADHSAAAPPAPTNVRAFDRAWDAGGSVVVEWDAPGEPPVRFVIERSATPAEALQDDRQARISAAEVAGRAAAERAEAQARADGLDEEQTRQLVRSAYEVAASDAAARERAAQQTRLDAGELVWREVGEAPGTATRFVVDKLSDAHEDGYLFRVIAVYPDGQRSAPAQTVTPVAPSRQWFDGARLWLGIMLVAISAAVLGFVAAARAGAPLRIRRIAGLDAVDEAVGRATEMGRSILFVPGLQDLDNIQTIAGLTVLSHVAKTSAEYDAKVEVPTSRSLVMTAASETVQAAYLTAGRPDAFNPDLIYYVTNEQFGYVAYLSGLMVRERPAACFYMGAFFAESLLLAEIGNAMGAIQIAGTAEPAQLPFFVAACDYTLIGEEFFAASAYLSGEPDQLGSLKGQDVGKLIAGVLILIGCAVATAAALGAGETVERILIFFRDTMLA